MSKRYGTLEQRLFAQVSKQAGGCWLWTGRVNEHGYGRIKVDGRKDRVHRISYRLAKGTIPTGECVLHSCDNPRCVNPAHLRLGSHVDNVADKVERDRQCRGAAHPESKLTEDQALAIRSDPRTQRAIAADFGVCHQTVGHIKRGIDWKHLESPSSYGRLSAALK